MNDTHPTIAVAEMMRLLAAGNSFRMAPGKKADRIQKIQEVAEFYGIYLSDFVIYVWFIVDITSIYYI